ncbi:MAG: AraC family transcriptional regulator [Lachnoclostridium sp.]
MKKLHSLAIEQKENAKHGEASFPIQKYITRLSSGDPVVTTHWHKEAELTFITSGSAIYQIDLVEYPVKNGDIVFIPPLALHSIALDTCDNFISETYVFHMNFLGGNSIDICSTRYLTPMVNQEFVLPYLIPSEHPAHMALQNIIRQTNLLYDEAAFGYELAIKSLFLQAIFLFLQYREENTHSEIKKSSAKLKHVLDYIEQHLGEPISISELAQLCYFSNYHFMRFFKKHMNMTCMEYIKTLRLEKSVEQFKQGNTSILDVSLSVGFHNLSYFHREFKKKYGMTPLTFIKELDFL